MQKQMQGGWQLKNTMHSLTVYRMYISKTYYEREKIERGKTKGENQSRKKNKYLDIF